MNFEQNSTSKPIIILSNLVILSNLKFNHPADICYKSDLSVLISQEIFDMNKIYQWNNAY